MRRLLAVMLIALTTLALPSTAAGFNTFGGKWSTVCCSHIQYWIYSSGAENTAWQSAVTDWNATATPIWIVSSGKADTENFSMVSVNNASVGWDGYTFLSPCYGAGCTYTYAEAEINRHFTDLYAAAKRQSVTEHEMGHVFGLAHPVQDGLAVLMNRFTCGAGSRWCTFSINTPKQDDVNGINAIY